MKQLDFSVAYNPDEITEEEVLKIIGDKLNVDFFQKMNISVSYWPIPDPLDQPDSEG